MFNKFKQKLNNKLVHKSQESADKPDDNPKKGLTRGLSFTNLANVQGSPLDMVKSAVPHGVMDVLSKASAPLASAGIASVKAGLHMVLKQLKNGPGDVVDKFIHKLLLLAVGLKTPLIGKLIERPLSLPQFLPILMLIQFVGCVETKLRGRTGPDAKIHLTDVLNSKINQYLKKHLQEVVQDIQKISNFLEAYLQHRLDTATSENVQDDLSTNSPTVQKGIQMMTESMQSIIAKITQVDDPIIKQCLSETMIGSVPILEKFKEFIAQQKYPQFPKAGGKPNRRRKTRSKNE